MGQRADYEKCHLYGKWQNCISLYQMLPRGKRRNNPRHRPQGRELDCYPGCILYPGGEPEPALQCMRRYSGDSGYSRHWPQGRELDRYPGCILYPGREPEPALQCMRRCSGDSGYFCHWPQGWGMEGYPSGFLYEEWEKEQILYGVRRPFGKSDCQGIGTQLGEI